MDYSYAITASYDGQPPHWTGRYTDAITAVEAWQKCVDHGFATEYATYNLAEPNGKLHTKNFYKNGAVSGK